MQPFYTQTNSEAGPTAARVVDIAARLFRMVRAEVRRDPPAGLTLTQVRALSIVAATPGASLSDVAEHLLIGLPTASKLIEELHGRRLVQRREDPADRRRMTLRLTETGKRVLKLAFEKASAPISALLAPLSEAEERTVREAMEILDRLISPCPEASRDE